MVRIPTVSISMRELDRLKCIQAVIDGDLKPGRAAERLGLTVRQIERLVLRYRAEGPIGLISRHRNRPGNRGLKAPLVEHVLSILREPDRSPHRTPSRSRVQGIDRLRRGR